MSDDEDIKPNAMVDQVDFNFGTDFQKQKISNNLNCFYYLYCAISSYFRISFRIKKR